MRCRCICGIKAPTLSQVNGEEDTLIGWYDGGLRAAGGKIRVLIAVRKN